MTTTNAETESEDDAKGLLVIGGTVKEIITTSEPKLVREHLGSLLQVKNLVVLLGSGASFHLGSPKTRDLTNEQVLGLIREAGGEPTEEHQSLLATINPTDSGDLEKLLNGLQLAASLATQAGHDSVTLGSGADAKSYPKKQVDALRQQINRALAEACRLPNPASRWTHPSIPTHCLRTARSSPESSVVVASICQGRKSSPRSTTWSLRAPSINSDIRL